MSDFQIYAALQSCQEQEKKCLKQKEAGQGGLWAHSAML